jgi:hypothetical protein
MVSNIMDRSIETVFEEVMAMDRASQITIAVKIMANVVAPHPYDAELRAELRSRVEAYRSGELKAVDWSVTLARIRKMIADARASQGEQFPVSI